MKTDRLSLTSRSIRYKLRILFYLIFVLPLLVTLYLISHYILPKVGIELPLVIFLGATGVISAVGFLVVKEVFDRITHLCSEAKMMAAGDICRQLDNDSCDEVGDLTTSLNLLSQRIHVNMDELKRYSEKTSEINIDIQKRVLVLSNLLQVSSLIAQGAKLDECLKTITEKSRLLASSDVAYLLTKDEGQGYSMKFVDGAHTEPLRTIVVYPNDTIFKRLLATNKPLILDKGSILAEDPVSAFQERFKMKNTLALPVFLRGEIVAILGIGNYRDSFLYKKDDVELLDIFVKQVAIAMENDVLAHRVEKLEVKDALTGLFNEGFISARLQEEIRRSIVYQRPCGLVLLNIDNYKQYEEQFGAMQAEGIIKRVASLVRDSVREIDRVGRMREDEFAIIIPERNKRQTQEVAEDIRRKVEFSFSEESDPRRRLTISGGVSENPLDGISAEELLVKARSSLNLAKAQGNRISG